jgi:two-component system, cell cycle response regulator
MRVMIAEDDRVSALILRRTLEKLGHEVVVTSCGEDAWSQYTSDPVPLVISDWTRPSADGLDLCRRIRSHNGSLYTYIILTTTCCDREDRLAGLEAGADDFLVKPLDTGELMGRLGVAKRILAMQEELHCRSEQLEQLKHDLEHRNEDLADSATYLTIANRRFNELFEGLPAACYSYDEEGSIHEWNRAAVEMFGYQPSDVLTRHLWEVFAEVDPEAQEANIANRKAMIQRIFQGEEMMGIETEEPRFDGQRVQVLANILPIRLPDGRISGAIAAHIDITERKALEKQVERQLQFATELNQELKQKSQELQDANAKLGELAVTDGLTGLKNHRYFRETLDGSFSYARREGVPFSVILMDVDKFKQFNDTFGHPAGDAVLRGVATVLRANVRAHDIVARYGGEEFVVLCPASDAAGARETAERLRQALEEHEWAHRDVTASFGISTFDCLSESASELVDQADKALYRSKEAGRNRVTHHYDLECGPREYEVDVTVLKTDVEMLSAAA